MNRPTAFVIASLFAALCATAQAQAPAAAPAKSQPAASASDPVVQMRVEERAARQVYDDKVSAARKERDAAIAAARKKGGVGKS